MSDSQGQIPMDEEAPKGILGRLLTAARQLPLVDEACKATPATLGRLVMTAGVLSLLLGFTALWVWGFPALQVKVATLTSEVDGNRNQISENRGTIAELRRQLEKSQKEFDDAIAKRQDALAKQEEALNKAQKDFTAAIAERQRQVDNAMTEVNKLIVTTTKYKNDPGRIQAVIAELGNSDTARELLVKYTRFRDDVETWNEKSVATNWGDGVTATCRWRKVGGMATVKVFVHSGAASAALLSPAVTRDTVLQVELPRELLPVVQPLPFPGGTPGGHLSEDVGPLLYRVRADSPIWPTGNDVNTTAFPGRCVLVEDEDSEKRKTWGLRGFFIYTDGENASGGDVSCRFTAVKLSNVRGISWPAFAGNDWCIEMHATFEVKP